MQPLRPISTRRLSAPVPVAACGNPRCADGSGDIDRSELAAAAQLLANAKATRKQLKKAAFVIVLVAVTLFVAMVRAARERLAWFRLQCLTRVTDALGTSSLAALGSWR